MKIRLCSHVIQVRSGTWASTVFET